MTSKMGVHAAYCDIALQDAQVEVEDNGEKIWLYDDTLFDKSLAGNGFKIVPVSNNVSWQRMKTAPKDRKIIVFCPGKEGLDDLVSLCQWHESGGFCVDEIREPVMWTEHPIMGVLR